MNELKGIREGEHIFVISKEGEPLMPTTRHKHAQRLLDKGKAYLISRTPWAIRLKYHIDDPKTQPITLGIDPGRENIGISLVREDTRVVIHRAKLETNNREVTRHMTERREHRNASRRGERLRRKRRAKKHGYQNKRITADGGRKLASCEEMLPVKDIINTEARFDNRRQPEGWLTPTTRNLVECHLSLARRLLGLAPITSCCFEWNKFAFMQLEDGSVRGYDYQNGRLRGYESVQDYVWSRQGGECHMPGCQAPIAEYHHVLPRSQGGSNRPENIVGLCEACHHEVHLGHMRVVAAGERAPFAGVSVLNQAVPYVYEGLVALFGEGNVRVCSGRDTRGARSHLGLLKDHDLDAVSVIAACLGWLSVGSVATCPCYRVRRFRRHDRVRVKAQRERSYKLDGRVVAKNRKPRFEQPKQCPGLSEAGLSREDISRLVVVPSRRSYNDLSRVLPGALFEVEGHGVCVMTGQQSRGRFLLFRYDIVDERGKPVAMSKKKKCRLLARNKGITYIGYDSS